MGLFNNIFRKTDTKNRVDAPDELDGAKVIKWAWAGNTPFGHIPIANGIDIEQRQPTIEVFGLAICKYENSSQIYRFCCDRNWEVQQDGVYKSVEDAISHLPDQYKNITPRWLTK